MGELQKRVSTLSQTQGGIASFEKLQASVSQTAGKLDAARGRVRELGEQMNATANPSAKLQQQFTAAHVEANKLQNKLASQRKELGQLRTSLSSASVDTKNFSNEQSRLAEKTRLAAEATRIQQAQGRLQQAQSNLDATKKTLSWDNIKSEIMGAAAPALFLAAPIKQASDFEQAMAKVGAVTGAVGEKFESLSAQARQLGRDTQFTAMQAANSQEMLARAGFETQEIINTMPALLNMAAAEGMDLANAADIAASTLRGYNLAASESARVADVLAKTSAASNTSISSLGESMKMAAPIAAGLKIPFEETAAMIGVMGDAGIKGSQAGTALRAALIRLSKEPKQTEEALRKLGIATRDTSGNLRTMPSLMKALSDQMAKMGAADKMGELSKIFGTEAASGMLALMEAAKSGRLQDLTVEIKNAEGAAAAMAERMNATAQGAMKRLSSASESLMIDIGNVMIPAFTLAVETTAKFTGGLSQLAQEFPRVTNAIVGIVAGFAAYKVGASAFRIATALMKLPLQHISLLLAKLNAAAVLAGHASVAAAVKARLHAAAEWTRGAALKAVTIIQNGWNAAIAFGAKLLDVGKLIIYHAKQIVIATATKAWTVAQWLWNAAMAANPIVLIIAAISGLVAAGYYLYKNWDEVCTNISAAWGLVWDNLKGFWDWLTNIFSWDGITSGFDAAFGLITSGISKLTSLWNSFMSIFSSDVTKFDEATAAKINNDAASFSARLPGTRHATGGIFNNPHVALIAEAGAEAVIPLEDRSRGIPLWKAAGESMGMKFSGKTTTNNVSNAAPNINITVNGGDGNIARRIAEEVRRVLRDIQEYNDRTQFS